MQQDGRRTVRVIAVMEQCTVSPTFAGLDTVTPTGVPPMGGYGGGQVVAGA